MSGKRRIKTGILLVASACICVGCAGQSDAKYTREELDNLARIEIYPAGSGEPVKVVEEEELLYRYNQIFFDDSDLEEHQKELEESAEELAEEYQFVSYKYPVSHFNNGEPEENMTVIIYKDSDIVKMTVSQESIKGGYVPEEYLTFYYELSDTDMEFYRSLAED